MHRDAGSSISCLVLCFILFIFRTEAELERAAHGLCSRFFFTFCFAKFVMERTLVAQAGPKLVVLLPKPLEAPE